MWSEDPGRSPTAGEPAKERRVEVVGRSFSTAPPLRWLFDLEGWRLGREENEFVLA